MPTMKPAIAARKSLLLAAAAVVAALAMPAMAQTVDELVTFRPDNRAGSAAAAAVIAEMIAERSQSAAVRGRARSMAPEGSLALGADELLMDIGAHAFIGSITGGGAVVPVAVAPVTRPAAPAPAPVVETVVVPTPTPAPTPTPGPAPAPTPAAPPVAAAPAVAPTATATPQRRQNWGISDEFSGEMRDLGGSPGGGGGGGGGWN